jgi:hypothetical protein
MRGLALLALAVVMLSFGPPARAAISLSSCTAGCATNASGTLQVDYTIPSDGQEYRWDLTSDLGHSSALISLQSPNDTSSILNTSNGDGTTTASLSFPDDFHWNEVIAPGHTTIFLWAPANFNFCSSNPPAGTLCSASNSVLGDTVLLNAHLEGAVITFKSSPVPEPAAWSLMIGGFLAVGWALRRRRSAAGVPA